jgi:peptidoglycan/xylan/chitin deacetylase (PgdA/CDA1 family)
VPLISFTFDDFPKSALINGGSILRTHDIIGTYYTSFGLMGKTAPTGEIFSCEDLGEFVCQGHELACHTFDHCHSWETDPVEFEASILRNQQTVAQLLPGTRMSCFSYPISHPRPETKRRIARHYNCARGGGQTFNVGIADLNYLKAFFIEQERDDFGAIAALTKESIRCNGWLIFATHDVSDSPTRFGCTPALLEKIVVFSLRFGAKILPVSEALQVITTSSKESAGRKNV